MIARLWGGASGEAELERRGSTAAFVCGARLRVWTPIASPSCGSSIAEDYQVQGEPRVGERVVLTLRE